MTKPQLSFYWGKTSLWAGAWAGACAAQGWDPKDDVQRRAVTLEAARKINLHSTCDSIAGLNQDQITALFVLLKSLAEPLNLRAARATANPEETKAADECRRVNFRIKEKCSDGGFAWSKFSRRYVATIAEGWCREHDLRHDQWEQLPSDKLKLLLVTLDQRRHGRRTKWHRRPAEVIEYQLKPRTQFVAKGAA
jgi:hypothetical protein